MTPFHKFHHIYIRECPNYCSISYYRCTILTYQGGEGGGMIDTDCVFFILCSEPNVAITATSNSPVTDGSPVTINCTASGNGVTRTVLRKDGMEAFGMTNSMLTIDSFANDPYAGTYDCQVENPIGMALSQGLRLDTCKSSSCVWVSVVCYHSLSPPPSHTLALPSQQALPDLVRSSIKHTLQI